MTTTKPLVDDTFEHGTPEGHTAGCKGDAARCPAEAVHGMSCTTAYVRSTTTPARYFRAKARDPRPAAIARFLGFTPPPSALDPEPAVARVPAAPSTLEELPPAPVLEAPNLTPDPEPDPEPVVDLPEEEPAEERGDTVPAVTSREIREWARENGFDVGVTGTIRKEVRDAYTAAHPNSPTPVASPKLGTTPETAEQLASKRRARLAGVGLHDSCYQVAVELAAERDRARGLAARLEAELALRDSPSTESPAPVAPDAEPARPDWGHLQLEHDLTQAIHERDEARSLAARLWDELDRLECTRAEEQAASNAWRRRHADRQDFDSKTIADLTRALTEARTDRAELRSAHDVVERALMFVLEKWRRVDAHLHDALGLIDQTMTGNEEHWADVPWTRAEVLELLEDIRSRIEKATP